MFTPNSHIFEGATLLMPMGPGVVVPYEYNGPKEEILASKESAWIGTVLTMSPIYDVKGPDAVKFLNSICINDFSKLGPNGIRHAVICNDKGQIMTDGVVLKISDDTYRTYWLNPPIQYFLETSGMDVSGEDFTGREYFIQIQGEKSLEILEKACECDLHDIKFARHKTVKIEGKDMRVLRLGMSGNLAYEVHGPMDEFEDVYDKIWKAGESFGAKKLGINAYNLMNHTEAGFPNIHIHYPLPWYESDDEGLEQFCDNHPMFRMYNRNRRLWGSVGDDLQSRFVTPYDVGWGFLVNFNHDFRGKEALQKLTDKPSRTAVTLEWNTEDVAAVFASQLSGRETEPCEPIEKPEDMAFGPNLVGMMEGKGYIYRADKVMNDGKWIGNSSGRIISYYYNRMISLAFVSPEYAVEGKELTLIWGTPGTPQKEIRVKVARFPYLSDEFIRNEDRDVSDIPRFVK